MSSQELSVKSFAVPVSQPALGGSEGLTHVDIAKSLGIRGRNFRTRFFELGHDKLLQQMNMNFAKTWLNSDVRGRPEELLVFPTDVARVLVANYPNEIGLGYAVWLVQRAHSQFESLAADLNTREQESTWLREDIAALVANQRRIGEPKPRAPRRLHVPFLVATLEGFRFELRKRAKHECEEWQWKLGLIPWAAHAIEALQDLSDDAVRDAVESLSSRFSASEFSDSNGVLHELLENLVDDMCKRPKHYIDATRDELSAPKEKTE